MKLKLTADKVTIRGPKIDGSLVITFELGEYQKDQWAELMRQLDFSNVVQLTIEQDEQGYKETT